MTNTPLMGGGALEETTGLVGSSISRLRVDPDRLTARGGKLERRAVARTSSAECLSCGREWSGPNAIAVGTKHSERAGHVVTGDYSARYVYWPAGGAR
jgi:hypothetical protein